jgi:hypothetical protein
LTRIGFRIAGIARRTDGMKQPSRIPAMFVGIAIIGLLATILLGPLDFAGASGQRQQARSRPEDVARSAALAQVSPEGSPVATPLPQGWLAITKVDAEGQPVAGACFSVFVDAGGGEWGRVVVMGDLCDDSDGQSDGELLSRGLQPGDYVLC